MPILGVLDKGKVPVKIWSPLDKVESGAMEQLINVANLPFVFKHVAVMPDVHVGKGATVGSVIATKGAICPAAVGVDIGCGMMAIKTNLDHKIVLEKLSIIRHSIERSVPVSHNGNSRITTSVSEWAGWDKWTALDKIDKALKDKAMTQLGSLGGGNHFIEVCLDTENNVWVMLHSGSRNVGKVLADRHINSAKDLMKQMMISLPDPDLAYLPETTEQFKNYIRDLTWCQDYAYQNRIEMMGRVMKDLAHAIYGTPDGSLISRELEVNCHHNYVSREHHFNQDVLVTRKGAVRAREGDLGIIPGSMGAKSFIVRGKGNAESFCSCSHGAGRSHSRSAAKRLFTLDDLARETAGVECRKDEGVLDEIPSAYKDIDQVMANQSDLVEVVAQIKQVLCIKG